MLQQILKDMYIDPDVLNALNDDQKKTLFLKMRQEQVRRWKEREEKLQEEHEENKTTKPKRANSKSVSWLLGRDGDVSVLVIGDVDELTSKFICSGFGENKAQSHQSNSYLQTILKSRKSTEAVKSERENVVCTTRPGISVNVKEKHEATNTSLPLLVSVSERSSPSAAHQRELKSQLSICSSSPERVSPVDTRPGLADMRQSAPSVPSHCGTTAATSSNMCSKEPQQSQESHDVAASEASRRAASGGARSIWAWSRGPADENLQRGEQRSEPGSRHQTSSARQTQPPACNKHTDCQVIHTLSTTTVTTVTRPQD